MESRQINPIYDGSQTAVVRYQVIIDGNIYFGTYIDCLNYLLTFKK
jgi:hypothetical protein